MNQEEREKRFEEKIGQHLKIVIKDYSQETCNDILAFIQSEIDLALANRNKELVEKIEKLKDSFRSDMWDNFIDELIYRLKPLITKDNE